MRLTVPEIMLSAATVRSTAHLITGDDQHELVYEAPASWQIDRSCAPFVPVATLLAAALGARALHIDGPIPEVLLEGSREATKMIGAHFSNPPPDIVASTRPSPRPGPAEQRVALFLSRGVDSSANLVLADQGRLGLRPDLAIVVAGIDTALDPALEARLNRGSREAAAEFGLDTVVVASNLRPLVDHHVKWIEGYGMVLAGAGLLLSPHLSDAIISSAVSNQQYYTGAHPKLDPLWSNGAVAFHHLPDDLDRSERVELIVADGRPLRFLRVCWHSFGEANCGRCKKCMQTIALIKAFGGDPSHAFEDTDVSAEDLRISGPGYILRTDFVRAAPPDLAAAVAERLDAVDGRPAPSALHEARRAQPNGQTRWLALVVPGPEAAAIVAAATSVRPGMVLAENDAATTHVVHRATQASGVTMWSAVDPTVDGLRAVDCLGRGSRPLIIHPEEQVARLRAALPEPLRELVGGIGDIPAAIADATGSFERLATHLAAGGVGWVRSA